MESVDPSKRRDFCGVLMVFPKEVAVELQIWLEGCVSDRTSACLRCLLETDFEEALAAQSPRTSPGEALQSMSCSPLQLHKD